MMARLRPVPSIRGLGALLLTAAIALLVFGAFRLFVRRIAHKYYEVEGTIRVTPMGPSGMTLPAVACLWAGHGAVAPHAVSEAETVGATAYIICDIPADGARIPFKTSTYGNTGYGIQIGAYLRAIPWSHPSCADAATPVALVSDKNRALERICSYGELAPKSEIALAAPFDGGDTRATETLRIVVTRAE